MAQNKTILEAHKRMTLEVITITKEETVGRGSQKLSFRAKADDKELTYASFVKSIHPIIKDHVGKTMDCDVEISEHEYDGQMYQDRLVLDVFIDGKSSRQEQRGGSGSQQGGRPWQPDSPEKIASIEAQTIFNGVTQALVAKVILLNSDLGEMWQTWAKQGFEISQKFRNAPAPAKSLVEAAKEMGAEEVKEETEPIDWGDDVKIDEEALKQLMTDSNWKDSTIKSWSKSTIKVDSKGQPLDTSLELIPFLHSMGKENVDKLFKMMESKRRA